MKKLYTLLLSLSSILIFSQGSINFDTDVNWSPAPSGYGNYTYTDGVFTATGVDVLRNGTAAQDGFPGAFDTYSVRLRNNGTTSLTMLVSTGGIGNYSFQVRRWDGAPDTNFAVETTTDGTTWTPASTINASVTTDSDWKTVNGTINSANANVGVRIISLGTTERIMVDNFTWTSPSTNPSLLISSPSNATVYSPVTTSVNVALSISNFNVALPAGGGDGHIHYQVTKDAVPQGVVMKYDTAPIALTGLTPGSYSVYVELVDNAHNPIAPAVNATVTFVISSYTVVANLAALRADVTANGAGKYYQVSSNPVITYARSSTYRNQKYIQDASAGILIDDLPGTISTAMVNGDAISGLRGQTSLFSGVLQLLPLENATVASSGNTVTPQVVTIADITGNIETYESELVQINAVSFVEADGSTPFATSTNYTLDDTANTLAFRTSFAEANYIGSLIPSGTQNVVVLVAEFNGTAQVTARNVVDMPLETRAFNTIDGLTMYPNPSNGNTLYFTTSANAELDIQVYDVLGKQIINSKVLNNTLNISNLNQGIYIVKITEEGKTATRKLVVK